MARLTRLALSGFRNIAAGDLQLGAAVNLFYGANGSGKTSILEAVHMLATGRSFRSRQHQSVIQRGSERLTVFGRLDNGVSLGVERLSSGGGRIRVNQVAAESSSQLAQLLPLQLINSDSFAALEGGPGVRRRLLDWTVFHVEHHYLDALKGYQIALRQRNALLRRGKIEQEQMGIWEDRLVSHAAVVDKQRARVFADLEREVFSLISRLPESLLTEVSIRYRRGWKQGSDLGEALRAARETDLTQGHTRVGPHRADLAFAVEGQPAQTILSRGQQKMLVCALRTAMARVVAGTSRLPVFLIDDLPAELDSEHQQLFATWLTESAGQVLVTGIDKEATCRPWLALGSPWNQPSVFHVEHGRISAESLSTGPNNEWSK
ncbi:DNA replication and repair protein RecF [Microbulbifer flavimaris]|uniref:DNA replication and repair protein RecF n=1 Tax=Microbulbifer flavimaris TaxID=1781068 RepID=A0ABX4HYQ2_9GAMM|nr:MULTISPECIES: DNA replication/repair protein RecF [Microbulbifer]KUJ83095.1 recombination protein F [Microbulbifer sp. ZGT114]PCO05280.1 DNA replication and repair protein RecF [Microbulbifer flavimaris]